MVGRRKVVMLITEKYNEIISKYGFSELSHMTGVNSLLKEALDLFVPSCSNPAIWCYGEHTKMLMAGFINELKTVKFIVDKRAGEYKDVSGFQVICSSEIYEKGIDGIIISSYKFRGEIKKVLEKEFPDIKFLDIYDYFQDHGIYIDKEYYVGQNPYERYRKINKLQMQLMETQEDQESLYFQLINCFIEMKDFFLAQIYAQELHQKFPKAEYKNLADDLTEIFNMECTMAENIPQDNVLMLCIDGLRDKDISERETPEFERLARRCYRFSNAYSISTSTYESLIPAYSENTDMRTRYYVKNCICDKECDFIQKAYKQERNILFYTDSTKYIDSGTISYKEVYQTATEKLWDFILDAYNQKNGLFYVHILFESHYSYPSPYVKTPLIAEGTSIMFDFMQSNGGQIRTDYEMQHHVMLKYLDDVAAPILNRLRCRMVIYADHGNIILDQQSKLEELKPTYFTYHQDLIRIPIIISAPEMGVGSDDKIISLLELNTIIISLLEKTKFDRKYIFPIKVQRSEIYNPDFQYVYKKCGKEQYLLAFEAFIFENGYKLGIYSNGYTELVEIETDELVENADMKKELYQMIREYITVCKSEDIVL